MEPCSPLCPGVLSCCCRSLHSHIWTRGWHLPHPAPHSHPQSSSASISATTPVAFYFLKCGVKKKKNRKKKAIQNCCGQASEKKAFSKSPRAAPGAEGEEAWGPAREAVLRAGARFESPEWFHRGFQGPGSGPAPALLHRAARVASATCPRCQLCPCSRPGESQGAPGRTSRHSRPAPKPDMREGCCPPKLAGVQSTGLAQCSQYQRGSAEVNHWNVVWAFETCQHISF